MVVPLDEYPIHQAPVSMAYFATSDRNVYDRCTLHCSQRDGGRQLIAGLGVYPHLGVIDGFVTLRVGSRQLVVRTSDALGGDRMTQAVGPIRIEVVEPLRTLRLICEDTGDVDSKWLSCDLTFQGAMPACDEPRHITRTGGQTILNAQRFIQTGSWSGVIAAGGEEIGVDDDTWVGARDRSWGIRPVGEVLPRDGPVAPQNRGQGHWHVGVALRFAEFSVVVMVQELPDGTRVWNEAMRSWPAETGRGPEQLGWPEVEIHYRPGTRHPESVVLHLMQRGRRPVKVRLETLGFIPLHVGVGYGGDPDWTHGAWKGAGWVEGASYDYKDPQVAARIPNGVIVHVAAATFSGSDGITVRGSGVFEHGSLGRHDPSGFLNYEDVWSAE